MIDYEKGSTAMIAAFVIGLFVLLFLWIAMGSMLDTAFGIHGITSTMGAEFPVSDQRISTLNFAQSVWSVLPFLFMLLLVIWAVVVGVRRGPGEV